jgi:hypothetical protein
MSDEPTNIIRRSKPVAKPEQPARAQGGTIRFSCSNGHAITVPAKLAGKRGACSKCGVAVVIPLRSDEPGPPGPVPEAAEKPEESVGAAQGVTEPGVETAGEAMAGPPVEVPDFSGIGGAEGEAVVEPGPVADAFDGLADAVSEAVPPAFDGIEPATTPEMDGIDNPTAVLVAKLFGETEHGGVVELHLKSGQIVMPLFYDFNWSRGTHGVFAAENSSDKTITLMAVAWDSVEQVIIRKVKGLPDGMFE